MQGKKKKKNGEPSSRVGKATDLQAQRRGETWKRTGHQAVTLAALLESRQHRVRLSSVERHVGTGRLSSVPQTRCPALLLPLASGGLS